MNTYIRLDCECLNDQGDSNPINWAIKRTRPDQLGDHEDPKPTNWAIKGTQSYPLGSLIGGKLGLTPPNCHTLR